VPTINSSNDPGHIWLLGGSKIFEKSYSHEQSYCYLPFDNLSIMLILEIHGRRAILEGGTSRFVNIFFLFFFYFFFIHTMMR
jgi:hypothetical protein